VDGRGLLQKAVPWLKLAAGVLAAATAGLAIVNNLSQESVGEVYETASASHQTVIYRRAPASYVAAEQLSLDRADEGIPYHPRTVQTVRFLNPNRRDAAAAANGSPTLAAVFEPTSMTRVSGFVAFSGKESTRDDATTAESEAVASRVRPDFPRKRGTAAMNEVDQYLWEVYLREPTKKDRAGDFTWKDPAAAKRLNMTLVDYVIGGMDPDFREQLYHAGRAMDAAGLQWTILSAFRDDYRQRIAAGFKARVGRSLHGGSRATGGYGHGRAVDIMGLDGSASEVWQWLDAHGAKYGLYRPIPGPDPAHVQSRGDWRKIAHTMRQNRVRVADANGGSQGKEAAGKAKVAKAGW
jgi:hypothetical protein